MDSNKFKAAFGLMRLSLGLVFLWAFFDKVFGLGFATTPEHSWLAGNSPTAGFLGNAVHGPLASYFHSLAGSTLVDWLFMLGLLFIGATLTLGIMVKLGSYAGALMVLLMYLAVGMPPENHPFIDEHFIYFFAMLLFAWGGAGKYFGLGRAWANTLLVQKHDWLR
jgi:thiosulfate dehydrogenase [quinone] large subunit